MAMTQDHMRLTYKIWLENMDSRAFGEGPYRLLKGVELTGSLWEAAVAMGMAYSKARRVIAGCERSLGFPLTRRQTGGATGGGSEVTRDAFALMRTYESLRSNIEEAIGELYRKHFGHSVQVQLFVTEPRKRREREASP